MSFKLFCENELLADNAVWAETFWSKLRGFMFYLKPPQRTLVFPGVTRIHMYCVFFPLAILVLDRDRGVLDKFLIRPGQLSAYYPKACYILESPRLNAWDKIALGSSLEFQE